MCANIFGFTIDLCVYLSYMQHAFKFDKEPDNQQKENYLENHGPPFYFLMCTLAVKKKRRNACIQRGGLRATRCPPKAYSTS